MNYCYHCNKSVKTSDIIGRTDTCPFCDADLHCCLNCRFHDPGSYNECAENQAERVLEKDRSNFCDYFSFKRTEKGAPFEQNNSTEKSNPLDNFFKK